MHHSVLPLNSVPFLQYAFDYHIIILIFRPRFFKLALFPALKSDKIARQNANESGICDVEY